MKVRRSALIGAVCLVGVFILGMVIGSSVHRGQAAIAQVPATACNVALLSGSYGVNFTGNSQGLGHFASVSLWQFDGYGNVSATESYNSDQEIGTRSVSGTYSVNADCTFTLMFASQLVRPHDVTGICVLVSSGAEFYCLDNTQGWVAIGTGKRI